MECESYITDAQVVKRAKEAVRIEIEKHKAMDNPIVVFESKTGLIYNENNDGSREIIGERLYKKRYSERLKKDIV